jgi:hypothetical protein
VYLADMTSMLLLPLLQAVAAPVRAETLLVRPVAIPAPWYEVATGVFAIVALLLLLGIVVLLAGAARAMKGTESSLTRKLDTLGGEIVPLLRRLHEVTGDLQEITRSVKGDLQKLSGTATAVDGTVRDVLAVTEARVARVAAMVDEVTDEAQAQVSSARALLADVRRGASSMVQSFGARTGRDRPRAGSDAAPPAPPRRDRATPRGAPLVAPPLDLLGDDEEEEWVAEPMAPSAALRARRRASIATPASEPRADAAWEQEADALIDEAQRALGRHFASGALDESSRATMAADDDLEADPDDPAVRARAPRAMPTPPVDPWRTGGPRLRPRHPGA